MTKARSILLTLALLLATVPAAGQEGICTNTTILKRDVPPGMICVGGSQDTQPCLSSVDCPGGTCGHVLSYTEMDDNFENVRDSCTASLQTWPDDGNPFLTTGGNLSGTTSNDLSGTDPELWFFDAQGFDVTRQEVTESVVNKYRVVSSNTIVSGAVDPTNTLVGTKSDVLIPAGELNGARYGTGVWGTVQVDSDMPAFNYYSALEGLINYNGTGTGGTIIGTNSQVNNYNGTVTSLMGSQTYVYNEGTATSVRGGLIWTDNYGPTTNVTGLEVYRPSNSAVGAVNRYAFRISPVGYNESPPSGNDFAIYSEVPQPSFVAGDFRTGLDVESPCQDPDYWNYPCSNIHPQLYAQQEDTRVAGDLSASDSMYGGYFSLKMDAATAQNSFARGAGLYGYHWTPPASTVAIGSLEGAFVTGEHNGSGDFNSIAGFDGYAYNASADGSLVIGGSVIAESYGGTVTRVLGQYAWAGAWDGAVTDLISLDVDEPSSTATSVTNRYAIRISDYSSDDNVTNDWAIYSELPQRSWLGGGMRFPSVNDPAEPTICLGDCDAGFYEESDDQIRVASAVNSQLASEYPGSWGLRQAATGPAVPTLIPKNTFQGSGIGAADDNEVSLIILANEVASARSTLGLPLTDIGDLNQLRFPLMTGGSPASDLGDYNYPSLAFGADGDTGWMSNSEGRLSFYSNGGARWNMEANSIQGVDSSTGNARGADIRADNPANVATVRPNVQDPNTGYGQTLEDQIDARAGGDIVGTWVQDDAGLNYLFVKEAQRTGTEVPSSSTGYPGSLKTSISKNTFSEDTNTASGIVIGSLFQIEADPASDITDPHRTVGAHFDSYLPTANTFDIQQLVGITAASVMAGDGDFEKLDGVEAVAVANGAGTGEDVRGAIFIADINDGTATRVIGGEALASNDGATVTNLIGWEIPESKSSTGSTTTNRYGLKLTNGADDVGVTNDFAIWSDLPAPTKLSGRLFLPQVDDSGNPTFAFGDLDTGIYESLDDTLRVAIAGAAKWQITAGQFRAIVGPALLGGSAPSSVLPSVIADVVDINTGWGRAGEDQISGIAGGVEVMRITQNDTLPDVVKINDVMQLNAIVSAPACAAGDIGSLYADSSGALCFCDGSAWLKIAGGGATNCT